MTWRLYHDLYFESSEVQRKKQSAVIVNEVAGGIGNVVPCGTFIRLSQWRFQTVQHRASPRHLCKQRKWGQCWCGTGQRLGTEWGCWNELWAWVRHPLGNARGWVSVFLVKTQSQCHFHIPVRVYAFVHRDWWCPGIWVKMSSTILSVASGPFQKSFLPVGLRTTELNYKLDSQTLLLCFYLEYCNIW